ALLRLEVVLHPDPRPRGVDPHEGIAAVAVHVAPGARGATVGHQDCHLVERLGRERPEVPLHVAAAQAGAGHTLLRADEVLELAWVADEEDQSLAGPGRCRHSPARRPPRRSGRKHGRALAHLAEEGSLGPGTATLRVNDALGHAFAIEGLHLPVVI